MNKTKTALTAIMFGITMSCCDIPTIRESLTADKIIGYKSGTIKKINDDYLFSGVFDVITNTREGQAKTTVYTLGTSAHSAAQTFSVGDKISYPIYESDGRIYTTRYDSIKVLK